MAERIEVKTPVLAAAAGVIGALRGVAGEARAAAQGAGEGATAFGGEPAGGPFADACAMGVRAVDELEETIDQLSQNVAMAALGYLNTDLGIVPIAKLERMGFKP